MFENTFQLVSLIIVALASVGTGFLLGIGESRPTRLNSVRLDLYHRGANEIDALEKDGTLDQEEIESRRAELLQSAQADPNKGQIASLFLTGRRLPVSTAAMSTIAIAAFLAATGLMQNLISGGPGRDTNVAIVTATAFGTAPSRKTTALDPAPALASNRGSGSGDSVAQLENYVKKFGSRPNILANLRKIRASGGATLIAKSQSQTNVDTPSLPDVGTMTARLAARLKKSPYDAEGWRMLGWSYFHSKKYAKSVAAYEKARELNPGSNKIKTALDTSRKRLNETTSGKKDETPKTGDKSADKSGDKAQMHPSNMPGPTHADVKQAAQMSPSDRQAMIKAMVDRLSARLEKSPRDADGWQRLIRSRIVLGESAAAQKALTRALEVFATEPKVKAKIAAMAKQLGVGKLN